MYINIIVFGRSVMMNVKRRNNLEHSKAAHIEYILQDVLLFLGCASVGRGRGSVRRERACAGEEDNTRADRQLNTLTYF